VHPSQRLLSTLLTLTCAGFPVIAGAGDLVAHNGFAECWEQATTKELFLDAARASVNDLIGCAPTLSGNSPAPFSLCDTNSCVGSQPGCLMIVQATTAPGGDFTSGSFSGTGTVGNMSIPVTVFGVPCTMSLTGIAFTYAWTNGMQADGNNGRYAADLPAASVNFDNYTLTSNCQGSVNSLFGDTAVSNAEDAVAAAIKPLLTTATVSEAVCPL